MPEGDTLRRTALALRPRLLGRRVLRAEPGALRRLQGSTVTEVSSLGKHLLLRFDTGHTLRTHLGMTGAWQVREAGAPGRPGEPPPRALLETEAGQCVLFRAPTVELTRTGAERTRHLGPDLLDPAADLDLVVRRARSLPAATPLGVLLLDQRVAAGIGNIHRCELLWSVGLSPWRPQSDLGDEELRDLYARARQGLQRGVTGGPHRHAVHGRGGLPCPHCGEAIRVRAQAAGELARTTYWCPRCQPDPRGNLVSRNIGNPNQEA